MKALYLLNEQLVDELGKGIPERNSYRWTVIDNLKEAIEELEIMANSLYFARKTIVIKDALIKKLEQLSSNCLQLKSCDNCKHYVVINKSDTMVCALNMDCIRKHKPKDRWEVNNEK